MHTIQLPDNTTMPMIGFGTWQLSGLGGRDSIQTALQAGYRLLDTAQVYNNEKEVGNAMLESGITRQNIFITTKIRPSDSSQIESLIQERLELLKLEYIDLLLIHWPADNTRETVDMWQRFVEAKQSKLIKHIGVSNFGMELLEHITQQTSVAPSVNQIEVNPLEYPRDLIEYCHNRGIVVQAYSPFGKGPLLENDQIESIAKKYDVSCAQLIIRWSIQHNLVPLPRSENPEHIVTNIDVFNFDITDTDMNAIDALAN